MAPTLHAIRYAKWEVLWVTKGKKGPQIHVHDCDLDFVEALRVYEMVKRAGKRMPTLRSRNVAFPPTDKYADHTPIYKTVRKKGKRYLVKREGKPVIEGWELIEPKQYYKRMRKLNLQGIWWCSYCMQMRRFDERIGFISDISGVMVEQPGYYCPMCDISHRAPGIRKYNPLSGELAYRGR